ncbi:DUF4270 domain-containing protein [Myroides sp. WP-1]|uniref:DUF4270 domain-containing protein n=1 Tax=Myroides sp. WP-1 TaxID=2759944 RepID=UPI0015FE4929|nr:DUF4270 domain-containing protein [Myroides sp. WP-1]MBB1140185.1 DUF4270 domain-containing protein [Myroides sp. WP-1]
MNYKGIIKTLAILAGVASLQSCDKDFSEVGGEIIGDNNLNIDTYQVSDLTAYTQPYGALATKNLANMPFGSLDNGEFGRTNSSFVTQVLSSSTTFTMMKPNAVIDSAYVYIPYYSQYDKVENEVTLYKLLNVTGDGTFNLEVYENGYFLQDVNPGTGKTLDYFSDASAQYEQYKNPKLLNDSPNVKQNKSFEFTKQNIIIYKYDDQGNIVKDETTGKPVEKEKMAPGLWLDLNKEHFQKFATSTFNLNDQSQFKNFFRGLYFKATGNSSTGALGLLNIGQGKLVLKYHQEVEEVNDEGQTIKKKQHLTATLPFSKNADSDNTNAYGENLNVSLNTTEGNKHTALGNKKDGDAMLYVKGGEGNVAVIDLFNKNDFEELKKLKEMNVLINDAILTVHVDETAMNKNQIPERLYLYNYDNGTPISDFLNDNSANASYSKLLFGGIYQAANEESKIKGNTYKFRITEYIRAILKNKELKSPKLAIAATFNYNEALTNTVAKGINSKLKTEIENTPENVTYVPSLSAMQPLGTVIYGTNTTSSKKMTLQIFYTKTKN